MLTAFQLILRAKKLFYIRALISISYVIFLLLDIAEEGEDAFAAMRRAKQKSSLKGKGKKGLEVPPDDLKYGLEKVELLDI